MVGSNVLVGGPGGQLDFLSTAGYNKLGLPGDMIPPVISAVTAQDHIDQTMGLAFHSDSAFLRDVVPYVTATIFFALAGIVYFGARAAPLDPIRRAPPDLNTRSCSSNDSRAYSGRISAPFGWCCRFRRRS